MSNIYWINIVFGAAVLFVELEYNAMKLLVLEIEYAALFILELEYTAMECVVLDSMPCVRTNLDIVLLYGYNEHHSFFINTTLYVYKRYGLGLMVYAYIMFNLIFAVFKFIMEWYSNLSMAMPHF